MTVQMRKSRALALTAALVPALVAAGCGGGSSHSSADPKPPTASQPLSAWISAFQQAVASGSCTKLKAVYPLASSCQAVLAGYKSAHVTGSARFGTGALVDFGGTSSHSVGSGVLQRQLTLFLTLDPARKWEAIDSQWFGHSTVGTKAGDLAPFKNTAAKSYAAVSSRNCVTAYRYSLVPSSVPEREYCAGVRSSPVVTVMAANPHPRAVALGGTADVQFFGYFVTLPKSIADRAQHGNTKGYLTLAVVKVPPHEQASNPYLVEAEQPGPPPS